VTDAREVLVLFRSNYNADSSENVGFKLLYRLGKLRHRSIDLSVGCWPTSCPRSRTLHKIDIRQLTSIKVRLVTYKVTIKLVLIMVQQIGIQYRRSTAKFGGSELECRRITTT